MNARVLDRRLQCVARSGSEDDTGKTDICPVERVECYSAGRMAREAVESAQYRTDIEFRHCSHNLHSAVETEYLRPAACCCETGVRWSFYPTCLLQRIYIKYVRRYIPSTPTNIKSVLKGKIWGP